MTREERNAYCREYRAKRKAAGICVRCGRPAKQGRVRCTACLEDESKRQTLRYRMKAMEKFNCSESSNSSSEETE